MPSSPPSSRASASCRFPPDAFAGRIEWRPSRWLAGALAGLAGLAAFSVFASEMPRWAAWPLAVAALLHGGRLALREMHRPARWFVFPGNGGPVLLDGAPLEAVRVRWRGPLAFISWRDRDGRRRRLGWWPDALPPSARRELRLAAGAREVSRPGRAMAP